MVGNTRLYEAVRTRATMDSSPKESLVASIKHLSVIREHEHDMNHERWERIQTVIANSHAPNSETLFKNQAEEIISIWLETVRS